jgi:hypothetical protein
MQAGTPSHDVTTSPADEDGRSVSEPSNNDDDERSIESAADHDAQPIEEAGYGHGV